MHSMVYFLKWVDSQSLIVEVHSNEELKKIIEEVKVDPQVHPEYRYQQGVLFYTGRLALSEKSIWIRVLLQEYHSTPQGGHSGFFRTYRKLVENMYWKGVKAKVQQFVRTYDTCQRQKYLATVVGVFCRPYPF